MSDDEVFCAILESESETEQRELVESLCAGNSAQIERVWRLLNTHRQMQGPSEASESILDRPDAVFQAFSEVAELKPGKQVGKYVLCELIGQGATSLVFRARQLIPIEREVALKLLKPGMDSQRILARFGFEHQVIKRLEHPGITAVYDAGVQDNGRPFFAMELVPSPLTITEYAENFGLEIGSRVRLMIATCDIVQHAHQRGVIHRDLKPSNILIHGVDEPIPSPRIIDFGIAKIMQPSDDSGNFTTLGDRFGTPAYMSPEQALLPAGSVDIRSDVYSLGIILYELLTGLTPRKTSCASVIEPPWTSSAYWEYEVVAPSRVNKMSVKPTTKPTLLGRRNLQTEGAAGGSVLELDWITLKAIAKDRQDRYQTVADMQRDLQRFLNGEPLEAAGPSLAYRVKKLVNRNRAISMAAAVTLITILITSIMTTFYAFRALDAQRQVQLQLRETLQAQNELRLERDRAEEAMRQSQSLLRVFQVQSVTDRSLARYLKQTIEAAQRGQMKEANADEPAFNIQLEALTKPHDRLIVRGDWTWASSRFPEEIINASFQITSSEAAQVLPLTQDTSPPATKTESQLSRPTTEPEPQMDPSQVQRAAKSRISKERESYQVILLEELRHVLPDDDPFIAEVLDNCGLQELERNSLTIAERFLTESVRIWEKNARHPANLAQSQLFLAETLSRMGQFSDSKSMLDQAHRSLDKIPAEDPHVAALRQFYSQVRGQLEIPK